MLRGPRSSAITHGRVPNPPRRQGLGSELIEPDETANRSQGAVLCRERLGGLLRYYYRDAA